MSKNMGAEEKINTRRLKPVYDALDSAQPKKALQEADKVLKKQPNMPAGRALKALSLIRLERSHEAFDVLSSLEKEMEQLSFDDNTYSAMCHAYKEAFTPERIPRMYELLCSRNPQSEQYMTHLFMSYARIRDYKNQQQVAMKLYKEFQKPAYFFWGIMSVVMQALTDPKLGSTMFFPLAEKMIEKYFENRMVGSIVGNKISHALTNDGELKVYLTILEGRNRYEDAIKLLEEPHTMRVINHADKKLWSTVPYISPAASEWVFRRIVNYLKILNKHERIQEECERAMDLMKSDWFLVETYNDSLLAILKKESDENKKSLIAKAFNAELYKLERSEIDEKSVSQDHSIRTRLLGQLELMSKLVREKSMGKDDLPSVLGEYLQGQPIEYFKAYSNYYYKNPSCFTDIRDYLVTLLDFDDQTAFVKHLEDLANRQQNDKPNCASIVLLERAKRLFGLHAKLSKKERWDLIHQLLGVVQRANEKDITAAALAQMIGFLFWDMYRIEDDFTSLYHLTIFLEYALSKFPGEQNIRVLACRVYGVLGSPDVVQTITRQLDVKYIQRDTLAFLLFPLAEQYGLFRNAIVYFTGLSSMYDQHEREIAECLVNAYKYSQYDQIPKFIDFWLKSTNSIYSQAADLNNQYLAPAFAVDNLEIAIQTLRGDELNIDAEKLVDNRDLKSIFTVENDEYSKQVEEWQTSSFKEMVDMLKFRKLLCRCAGLIGKETITYEEFSKHLVEMRMHEEYCQKTYVDDTPSKLIHAFTPFRLAHFMKAGYFELLDSLFDAAAKLIALRDSRQGDVKENEPDEAKILEVLPKPDAVFDAISKFLPQISKESLKPLQVQDVLFDCAEAVGVVMFSIVLIKLFELLICHIYGRNPVAAAPKSTKKDKKKKDNEQKDESKEKKSDLVDRFELMKPVYGEQLAKLDSSLELFKDFVTSGDFLPVIENNPFNEESLEEYRSEVHTRLSTSYLNSIDQMREVISRTQKRFFTRFADLIPGV